MKKNNVIFISDIRDESFNFYDAKSLINRNLILNDEIKKYVENSNINNIKDVNNIYLFISIIDHLKRYYLKSTINPLESILRSLYREFILLQEVNFRYLSRRKTLDDYIEIASKSKMYLYKISYSGFLDIEPDIYCGNLNVLNCFLKLIKSNPKFEKINVNNSKESIKEIAIITYKFQEYLYKNKRFAVNDIVLNFIRENNILFGSKTIRKKLMYIENCKGKKLNIF